jgi:hypothetical protein
MFDTDAGDHLANLLVQDAARWMGAPRISVRGRFSNFLSKLKVLLGALFGASLEPTDEQPLAVDALARRLLDGRCVTILISHRPTLQVILRLESTHLTFSFSQRRVIIGDSAWERLSEIRAAVRQLQQRGGRRAEEALEDFIERDR